MKKIIVSLFAMIIFAAIVSSCDTQRRCAAYGHYAYNIQTETQENLSE